MKTKIITSIYSNLYGTDLGGRMNRYGHYRFSLLSLLKMSNADFTCYTSSDEIESLEDFFYNKHKVDPNKLKFSIFDLYNTPFKKLFEKYKDLESTKKSDRCIEIQYMKFFWFLNEDMTYDNYFWFDAGLSHCGLIPTKYRPKVGYDNSQYFTCNLFNNVFLENLITSSEDKFVLVAKENSRNYWSGTVNPIHFDKFDPSKYIIGGFFGGRRKNWVKVLTLFTKYIYEVTYHDNFLYHEELIMTLMYRNHEELFKTLDFDTWWHEDERISGVNMEEHVRLNKSFYKIIEELNNLTK